MVCSMVSASACHSEESLSEASPPRGSCHPEGEVFSFSPDQAVPRGAAAAGKSFDEKGGPHNVPSDRSAFPHHVDDHHRGRPRAHRRGGFHVEVLGHVHAHNHHLKSSQNHSQHLAFQHHSGKPLYSFPRSVPASFHPSFYATALEPLPREPGPHFAHVQQHWSAQ